MFVRQRLCDQVGVSVIRCVILNDTESTGLLCSLPDNFSTTLCIVYTSITLYVDSIPGLPAVCRLSNISFTTFVSFFNFDISEV